MSVCGRGACAILALGGALTQRWFAALEGTSTELKFQRWEQKDRYLGALQLWFMLDVYLKKLREQRYVVTTVTPWLPHLEPHLGKSK